jgi:hypothetical protein
MLPWLILYVPVRRSILLERRPSKREYLLPDQLMTRFERRRAVLRYGTNTTNMCHSQPTKNTCASTTSIKVSSYSSAFVLSHSNKSGKRNTEWEEKRQAKALVHCIIIPRSQPIVGVTKTAENLFSTPWLKQLMQTSLQIWKSLARRKPSNMKISTRRCRQSLVVH